MLNAIHHDCVLYDQSCRLKQCYRCHEYGHIGPQCDAEERCGYCAGKHNTKECMAKETDPQPAPSCVLCKGQHTAWSNACPRRRKEMVRTEQARQNRPVFYYEADDTGRPTAGASMRTQEHATIRSTSRIGIQDNTSTPGSSQTSIASSQPRPYDLRKAIQPSTRLTGQESQTAHKRRRTVARRALAESSTNTRRGKVATQLDKTTPGENMQPILNFFEATPSNQQ